MVPLVIFIYHNPPVLGFFITLSFSMLIELNQQLVAAAGPVHKLTERVCRRKRCAEAALH